MDASRVAMLRDVLAATGWVERTRGFAGAMRSATKHPGGLLLVGTPTEEPWHLAAHLDDESRYSGIPELAPTLVRWSPPPGAPAHLSVGLDRLEAARRGEALLVVAPDAPPVPLLERVADARKIGATVLALDCGNPDLEGLAHEALVVPSRELSPTEGLVSMDVVQHLVSVAAGETTSGTRRGFRDRLARLLDTISGPVPTR
jgi:hypothetical protein